MLFLDFDGVICDSLTECLVSSWLAYHAHYKKEQPVLVPLNLKKRFTALRPYVRFGGEYLLIQQLLEAEQIVGSQVDFDKVVAQAGETKMSLFKELLYKVRHELLEEASWLVDGIFGTGLKGELREPVKALVNALNECQAIKVAIDVPTGVGDQFQKDYIAFQADVTLTMGAPKNCLYLPYTRPLCGEIVIINPGFPPELLEEETIPGELLPAEQFEDLLPEIPPTAYKTRRGHLAVFAGSVGTSGAAWLCSHAAARSRTGLVTFFADQELYPVVAAGYHSIIVQSWDPKTGKASREQDLAPLANYSAFLVGPGWGFMPEKEQWLQKLLATDKPGVIDADALHMIATNRDKKAYRPGPTRILTPHPGEFSAFTKTTIGEILTDPLAALQAQCKALDTNIILKGHITYIMAPDGRYGVLDGMNPSLATGGSGDVLSGIIAGFLAQGIPAFEAACAGVMLHSYLGKIAYHELGWFLAEDMLPYISAALAGSDECGCEGEGEAEGHHHHHH